LIDGRVVCSWCEDWRAETEARAVLAMPKDARKGYLFGVQELGADGVLRLVKKGVQQQRGKQAADDLAALVRRVWEAQRATR
jgi:hypothetical protein